MNADYTPPVAADAANRAWRTLVQGLVFDLTAAVAVAAAAAIAPGIEWTRAYWLAFGLALAKSAIVAIVSYVARKLVPPASTATGAV
jgi:hypothetical protein